MNKRNNILIYCDYGCLNISETVSEFNNYFNKFGYNVGITDSKSIIEKNALNDTVALFVMPGGRGSAYKLKLMGLGNTKIQNFVTNGGNYLGICAGAYYACSHTIFEPDVPELKIISDNGLNLVDASSIGTLYKELNILPYSLSVKSSTIVNMTDNKNNNYSSFYSGGPYFKLEKNNDNIEIMANYIFENNKKLPAILKTKYGNGTVTLSGVHFEMSGHFMKKNLWEKHPEYNEIKSLADKLIGIENKRLSLFNKIMQETVKLR